jgi:hypothetical protein
MEIEQVELMRLLQGHWKLNNGEQSFEINGTELTVTTDSKSVKTSFELIRNLQLRNWQIKVSKPMQWLRTFVVQITDDSFVIYDFDLKLNMVMGARSKLLNPSRVYNYTRVAVPEAV